MGVIIEMKNPSKKLDVKIKEHKKRELSQKSIVFATILMAVVSTVMLLEMQTYNNMDVVKSYGEPITNNAGYEEFSDGVLRYSRDGITFLGRTGEELWKQSYQLKNPVIEKSSKSVAVSEMEGNDVYVFGEDGMKGEVHTTTPIEKIAVSDNGIVAVLLKEEAPRVVCYDLDGKILVEHRASMSGTGYPIGMALSPDGTRLAVSYLAVADGEQATKIVIYDFGGNTSSEENYKLAEDTYKNVVIPVLYFSSDNKMAAVANDGFFLYSIKDGKASSQKTELDKEITSVFFEDKTMGFVLRSAGKEEQEVRLYNMSGKNTMSKSISGEYANAKLSNGNVILHDGKKVCLISSWGIVEFDGEIEQSIMEMVSLSGINKYLVMNAEGMDEIRLVK